MATIPKDAAAIILLKDPEDPKVYLVKRNPKLAFMGGFHTFPGGQVDKEDFSTKVEGCESETESAMRVAAIREGFEEAGVLITKRADTLSGDDVAEARAALESGELTFGKLLESHNLSLVASTLLPVGRWVTPPFSPRRFDTWFFLTWLPEGQEAAVIPGELVHGEWIRPADALDMWKRCESVMAPPTLHALRALASLGSDLADAQARFTAIPEANRGEVRRIEFGPGILFFPVKTPTLPPATHTNCYIIGGNEVVIIDPASPYEEEQAALDKFIDTLIGEGRKVREIFLTHHHRDHVAGSDHLRARLGVKVAAQRLTAERLKGSVTIDRFVEDGEIIELDG
ncbi:MAG: MBL fold metallo-hydrolase, partial [Blastocatellia bacterium]